jgi:hypothetical protein
MTRQVPWWVLTFTSPSVETAAALPVTAVARMNFAEVRLEALERHVHEEAPPLRDLRSVKVRDLG